MGWEEEERKDGRIKRIYQTKQLVASGFPKGNGVYHAQQDMNYRETHDEFCERTGAYSGFIHEWRPPYNYLMTDESGTRFSIKCATGAGWQIFEHVAYDYDNYKQQKIYHARCFASTPGPDYITQELLCAKWSTSNEVLDCAKIDAV